MGDCRIRIQHDASLERTNSQEEEKGREIKTLIDQMFASDSTVQELLEIAKLNERSVSQLISESNVCLWDCTLYPPVNITKQLDATATLFTAGWFPSARLQVLPMGVAPVQASSGAYDDEPETTLQAYGDVKFISRSGQVLSGQDKPSKLLQSAIDSSAPEDDVSAKLIRSENRRKSAQKRKERLDRLQKQIETLEQKSGKTSLQVRKMLIKSRASGKKNLQDRIHFKCYIVIDDDMTKCEDDYRFFSPQDTAGKVVESFAHNRGSRRGELLVATTSCTYGRLPILMRLYEAKEARYIEDFMTVIIRFYDPDTFTETPSIDEVDIAVGEDDEGETINTLAAVPKAPLDEKEMAPPKESIEQPSLHLPDLREALVALNSKSNKKSLKPNSSATVDKVKQMQIKAKAKGDGKRVKLPDRFYFELVVATKDCRIEKVQPVFLAQSDPLSRILRDHVGAAGSLLFMRGEGSDFDTIDDTSISLEDASSKGILTAFGQVVVYLDS